MLPSPDLRRSPEHSALHRLIREHLATLIEHVEATGHALPAFVRREMEAYLGCGLHASGFARVRCSPCGFERLVPFSCKGRGFCPSCGGRRMADTAAHLVDHVFRPDIPVRQWVLTLPHRLRYRLAYDHALTTAVLNVYTRTLLNWQRRRAGRAGQAGAITHIQRFGGGANLNVHFHTLVTDGVFVDDGKPAARFVQMPPPTPDDVRHLTATIARRIGRLLARRGDEPDLDLLAAEEPVLAGCAAAAIRQQQLFGPQPGAPTEREGGAPADGPANASPLSATIDGFNLHAATAVRGHDREGLERLCRYIARPPIATGRLSRRADGRYALRLKHPWRDGTTELVFDPLDLLARLAALIPPPNKNLLRYHGVYAPAASMRPAVVPQAEGTGDDTSSAPRPKVPLRRRLLWAELLRRVFGTDPLDCSRCGERMRLIALIDDPAVVRHILAHLGLPTTLPKLTPARAPPQQDFDFGA